MIDQQIVKNVILDMGGVLVDIAPQNTIKALQHILQPCVAESELMNNHQEVLIAMETGQWTKQQFYDFFKGKCKNGVIEEEIIDAWCAMVLDLPRKRVEMVKKLASKYSVFLLSNTNTFHIKCVESDFKNRYNYSYKKLFTKIYYSSEIGLRKPDPACFKFVLEDASLNPAETVMVDDMEENCLAAENAGMQALRVPENTGLEAVIHHLLPTSQS